MRATDRFCLATATYRSSCSCHAQRVVGRGERVPRCPRCGSEVDWEFVRSDYVPQMPSAERDAAPPRDGPRPWRGA